MIDRFRGSEGKRYLIEALKDNVLVMHNEALATRLAEAGELVLFAPNDILIAQGASDNDVYFIIVGEADVQVNSRYVGTRSLGDVVGEMALIHPTEARSATLTVKTQMVTLKVTEPEFQKIADEYPQLWKAISKIVAERLRARGSFLNAPNNAPQLFLGCSVESLPIVRAIQVGLKFSNIQVNPWTDGIFGPGDVTLDALLRTVNETDFAAFVFSEDDKVISRDGDYYAPRDNTVFELGLFMGQLDRNRTFVIKDADLDVKIPTDLLGITVLTYKVKGGNITTALATVCTEIQMKVDQLGVR